MHSECGYTFIGETSLYKLTLHEIRVLYGGYRITQQQSEDQQKGVSPSDRSKLQNFDERLKEGNFS